MVLLIIVKIGTAQEDYREYYAEQEAYFEAHPEEKNTKSYMRYQRAKWLTSSRLDENGSLKTYGEARRVASENGRKTKRGTELQARISQSNANWTFLGPIGIPEDIGGTRSHTGAGRVEKVFVDEVNDVVYSGSNNGGLFRSDDGGNTWECMTDMYPEITGIQALWARNDTIIIASGTSLGLNHASVLEGLFIKKGLTNDWEKINFIKDATANNGNTVPDGEFYPAYGDRTRLPRSLTKLPDVKGGFLLATSHNVLRTDNWGTTWTEVAYKKSTHYGLFDIAHMTSSTPGNEREFVVGNQILVSSDGGLNWSDETSAIVSSLPDNTNADTLYSARVTTHPNWPDKAWIFIEDKARNDQYIVKYDNGSYTTLLAKHGSLGVNNFLADMMALKVSPNDENLLYFGNQLMNKFVTGATAISSIATTGLNDNPEATSEWVHPDVRSMYVADSSGTDRVYVGHDGGLSISQSQPSSGRFTWRNVAGSMGITEFFSIAGSSSDPDILVGGTQDNAAFVYDLANTNAPNGWFHTSGGDGGGCAMGNQDPSLVVTGNYLNNNARISITRGTSDARYVSTYHSGGGFRPIKINPSSDDTLYISGHSRITMYTNVRSNGNNTRLFMANSGEVTAMDVSSENSAIIYAAQYITSGTYQSKIYRSNNHGVTWNELNMSLSDRAWREISDIEIMDRNSNEVWVSMSKTVDRPSVFHTTDGGTTWVAKANGLPERFPINDLEIDQDHNVIYAATDIGVYILKPSSNTWEDYNGCLPRKMVSSLVINQKAEKIRAAYFGRSIWEGDLYVCPNESNKTISGSATINHVEQALVHLTSSVAMNSDIKSRYESGEKITLTQGFNSSSDFVAKTRTFNCSPHTECQSILVPNTGNKLSFVVTAFNENNFENDEVIKVGPNPTMGELNLQFESNQHDFINVTLINSFGLELLSHNVEGLDNLHMSISQKPGNYILRFRKSNDSAVTKQLIVVN